MATNNPTPPRVATRSHSLELISTSLAIILALLGAAFFFKAQGWSPDGGSMWVYLLPWLVLGYLAVQLFVLLSTAVDSRSIGFIDAIASLAPALVGAIVGVEWLQGIIKLSGYQENALLLMIGTSLLESVVTLWLRFTVNRRTIGLDTGT